MFVLLAECSGSLVERKLRIEGLLVRDSPELLCCVFEQDTCTCCQSSAKNFIGKDYCMGKSFQDYEADFLKMLN